MTETFYYNSKNISEVGSLSSRTITCCNLTVPGIFIADSSLSNQASGFTVLYDKINTGAVNLSKGVKINDSFGPSGYVLTSTSNASTWAPILNSQWNSSSNISGSLLINSNIYNTQYNVGIGITNPLSTLHVQGTTQFNFNDIFTAQKLSNISGTSAKFGYSIAFNIDGTVALVGAPNASSGSGYAAIYRYSNNNQSWSLPQVLTNVATSGQFGFSVSLSADGNTALVGSANKISAVDGYAAIYQYSSGTWGTAIPLTSTAGTNANFGWAVALSYDGYNAIVSAPSATYVALYQYNGYTWGNPYQFNAPVSFSTLFGNSVSLNSDGTSALVGDPGFSNVSIYRYSSSIGLWNSNVLIPSGTQTTFGYAVSISADGNSALVGAPNAGITNTGTAILYRYNGSTWNLLQQFNGTSINSLFGYTVSLSADANTVLIGAPGVSVANGYVSYYKYINSLWNSQTIISTVTNANFGNAVALSADGNNALIGASNAIISSESGYVANYYISGSKFKINSNTFVVYNNNIGIGTSNPQYKLDVIGDINFTGIFRQNGAQFKNSQWTSSSNILGSNIYIINSNVGIGTISPQYTLDVVGDINFTGIFRQNGAPFKNSQWTSSSNLLGSNIYIINSNVGIGTTSPQYGLDVWGSMGVNIGGVQRLAISSNTTSLLFDTMTIPYIYATSIGIGTTVGANTLSVSGGVSIGSNYANITAPTNGLIVASNVGIGTTTPGCLLSFGQQIKNKVISIYDANPNDSTTTGYNFYGFGVNANYLRFQASGSGTTPSDGFYWYSANTERMRIQASTGNVGIGTANPLQKLHITNGDTSLTLFGPNTTWNSYLAVGSGSSAISSSTAQVICTNGNLHLDAGASGASGRQIYLNYYSSGNGVAGGGGSTIGSWGPWTHTGNFTVTSGSITQGGWALLNINTTSLATGTNDLPLTLNVGSRIAMSATVSGVSFNIPDAGQYIVHLKFNSNDTTHTGTISQFLFYWSGSAWVAYQNSEMCPPTTTTAVATNWNTSMEFNGYYHINQSGSTDWKFQTGNTTGAAWAVESTSVWSRLSVYKVG
jgi:hypothetical protein